MLGPLFVLSFDSTTFYPVYCSFFHSGNNSYESDMTDISALNERIERESAFADMLQMEVAKVIIGQKAMTERLLVGLLSKARVR